MTAWNVGDLVIASPDSGFPSNVLGRVHVVTEVPKTARGINYTAKPRNDPHARGLRGPAHVFKAWDPADAAQTAVEVPLPPDVGAVVTVDYVKIDPNDLYVVLGDSRGHPDCVKIARLGGDGGTFWPRIPVRMLTVVEDAKTWRRP